ncbi:sigma-54-dependent Fis family transcriptional regulator [Siculibacillus lacustris]|uniref:sigma-54-dependent Fis family transcriptional regulator n=1 Tax=Siculibacillus lacustris TaxID=1549641 RepID=UPI0013F15864|nr:sigma-54-dependent Fis family transcriptional regulator [Siculibacillus lacustris]
MTLLIHRPDTRTPPRRPSHDGRPPDTATPGSASPLIRYSTGRIDYATWKRFVDTGTANDIDPFLAQSWKRCVDLGVTPTRKHPVVRSVPLSATDERIFDLSRQLDETLRPALEANGMMICITDAEGRLVRTYGDAATLRQANRLHFGPGADWTEGSVGTNAIGTALETGRFVQIFGQEHFCLEHHIWRCTAAPFFDPSGRLMGCIDISSGTEIDHGLALRLVLWSVSRFERSLLQSHARELEYWPEALLAALPARGEEEGHVVVQSEGRVVSIDEQARRLLGAASGWIVGRMVGDLFDIGPFAGRTDLPAGPVRIGLKGRTRSEVMAEAVPLRSPAGLWLGMLIRLRASTQKTLSQPQVSRLDRAGDPAPHERDGRPAAAVPPFIGDGEAARHIRRQIAAFAQTRSTVLLTGESGTGKELAARGIHAQGERRNGPFVAVNCGAFAKDLIQSELFGYESGAFTGADRHGRPGLFERADRGVLFLDEICELPLDQQANLLRVLEERRVTRIGGRAPIPIDVKVIAATNRDMAGEVHAGRFRSDLYHRLCVATITLPPLRDRLEDVRVLVDHHFERLRTEMGLPGVTIDPATYAVLERHTWPGNVRALCNAVEYALNQYFVTPYAVLSPQHLPPELVPPAKTPGRETPLRAAEMRAIERALLDHGGNISRAARALGIGRNTLYAKLRRLPHA